MTTSPAKPPPPRAHDLARLRRHGLDELRRMAEQHCARLLDLAGSVSPGGHEDDPRWHALVRERRTWPALLDALEQALGHAVPLRELERILDLDQTERWLLLVLWALSASPALAWRAWPDAPGGLPAARLAPLVFADAAGRDAAMGALAPGGRLRRHGLIRTGTGGASSNTAHSDSRAGSAPSNTAPGNAPVHLDPAVSTFLHGLWRAPRPTPATVRVRGIHAPPVSTPPVLARALSELHRLFTQPPVRIALLGPPGAGKRRLVRAAASQLRKPLIEVRLDTAPTAPAMLRAHLAACARDARLYRAVLFVVLPDPGALDAGAPAIPAPITDVLAHPAGEGPGIAVLGIPVHGDVHAGTARVQQTWCAASPGDGPALACVPLEPLELDVLPATWSAVLAALGWRAPAEDTLEAHACHPGLVTGDLARAARTATARQQARTPDTLLVTPSAHARDLSTALAEHLGPDLDALAERLWPMSGHAPLARLAPDWAELVQAVRSEQRVLDAWGMSVRTSRLPAPLVVHATGAQRDLAAHARALARDLAMPLYRVDLGHVRAMAGDQAAAHLHRIFDHAERCGAVLLVAPVETLPDAPSALVAALADRLAAPHGLVLLAGSGARPLPGPVQDYVDRTVSAAARRAPA